MNESSGEIYKLPAAKKAGEVLNALVISSFAKVEIVDESGKTINKEDIVSESMKIKVIAEDGKTSKEYRISLASNGGSVDLHELYIKRESLVDNNTDKGIMSLKLKINKPKDEEEVTGYYIGICGQKLNDNTGWDNNYHLSYEKIYQRFIPVSNSNSEYTFTIDNFNVSKYDSFTTELRPVLNGKLLGNWGGQEIEDNIGKNADINTDGLSIGEFVDTNNEPGKLGGKIEFTKPADETNIAFYNVCIEKSLSFSEEGHVTHSSTHYIAAVKADGSNKYSANIPKDFDVLVAKGLKIVIIPVSITGKHFNDKAIKKVIKDLPEEKGKLELSAPTLNVNNDEPYSIYAMNKIDDTDIKLYVYDETKKEYVAALDKNGQQIVSWFGKSFYNLNVGKYKVTQCADEVESPMSNEVIVKPIILSGALSGDKLSLVNAIDGATIKLYDKEHKFIKEIQKVKDKEAFFEGIQNSTYFVTQTVNGIESDDFKVEL